MSTVQDQVTDGLRAMARATQELSGVVLKDESERTKRVGDALVAIEQARAAFANIGRLTDPAKAGEQLEVVTDLGGGRTATVQRK